MRSGLAAAGAILVGVAGPAFAHRLDEYLQATTISVEKDRVHAQIRLTPGVAVFPILLASIDTDADGVISASEQRAYAERVLRDLSLTVDGDPLQLRLVSSKTATTEEMREGRGDIQLEVDADVPRGGHNRRLEFENHHESRIAAYLVNCLVPSDPDIRVTAQDRSYDQAFYQLDYVDSAGRSGPLSLVRWPGIGGWLSATVLVLFARFAWLGRRRTRAA